MPLLHHCSLQYHLSNAKTAIFLILTIGLLECLYSLEARCVHSKDMIPNRFILTESCAAIPMPMSSKVPSEITNGTSSILLRS